ncbi:MAG: hypothetical protein HRT64_03525 [Erythrobacter sp.]|nr:hypothetical protein [Erythrobacter sp.]
MKPDALPLLAQAVGLASAVALAVFGPTPGRASQLLPLTPAASDNVPKLAAQWASREDAQLLAFDTQRARATVIAPNALSLARALSYGLVPIASEVPSCTTTYDGRTIESQLA